jgi:hypothetical protein
MAEKSKFLTPVKAIRAKCMDCSNNQYSEIKECPIKSCSLWSYRLGHRPKKNLDNVISQ